MKNKKNQLFNDILHFLDLFAVTVEDSNKDELKRLVVLLQNTFWHIDGHHHVFEQRALAVPSIFSTLRGYNVPERSKHRKRLTNNLSCDTLRELALELSTILNFIFWDKENWSAKTSLS